MRNRCWEKDYFTSALPWTQRGNPVKIPIAGSAPVVQTGSSVLLATKTNQTLPAGGNMQLGATTGTQYKQVTDSGGQGLQLVPNGSLKADLTNASSTTVNDLRTAFQLQRWLEKNARAGARYIENIAAHFGVISSDSRLQRPEYLGGGKAPVVISEVLQTSSSDTTTPQGTCLVMPIQYKNQFFSARKFEEHGFVMGIMSVMPRTCYQENVPRMFSRAKNTDYYWPEFAHLGEQAILGKELFFNPNSVTPDADTTFGYQSRYAEYRYKPSEVHWRFQDNLSAFGIWDVSSLSLQPLTALFLLLLTQHSAVCRTRPSAATTCGYKSIIRLQLSGRCLKWETQDLSTIDLYKNFMSLSGSSPHPFLCGRTRRVSEANFKFI